MKTPRIEHAVVDLRGVMTREQERVEKLRSGAREQQSTTASLREMEQSEMTKRSRAVDCHASLAKTKLSAYATRKTESSLRGAERSGVTWQSRNDRSIWNDIISGVFRVASIAVIVSGSWMYLPSIANSLAYFTDTEGAPSHMTTGFVDLIASSSPEVIELECGGMEDPEVYIQTEGNEANVSASNIGIVGSANLCNAIELNVRQDGETLYTGSLAGFYAENIEDGLMRFIVSLDSEAGPFAENTQCTTSIEYFAVQKRHGENAGFSDKEIVELAFSVDEDSCDECEEPPCDPCCCGDLYVDVTNENDGTVINDFGISTDTGGNEADGGDGEPGGDGGEIETGDAESEVEAETELNINETTIIQECCEGDECVEEDLCGEPDEQVGENEETCEEADDRCLLEEEGDDVSEIVPDEEVETGDIEEDEEKSEETEEGQLAEEMIADIQNQINEQMSGMLGV